MPPYTLNRNIITKRIIDLTVELLKEYLAQSRLYRHTDVSDRFALEAVQIPCIVVKSVSNTQKRVHFDDFMDDVNGKVELVPLVADDNIYGNNVEQVNLPESVDYDPRWPFDISIGYPSGTDINQTVYTSGTVTNSGVDTGIIISIPPPSTFNPTSISTAIQYYAETQPWSITGTNNYNMAMSINSAKDQFYLAISGTDITGTFAPPYLNMGTGIVGFPVDPNQVVVDGSGVAAGLSGTQIILSDVLFAGDQYQLNTYPTDRFLYEVYGGIYNISISFDCYARTTIEAQELGDLVQRILVEKKHKFYDKYGVAMTSWSQGGQSEREYVNDHLFTSSISSDMFIEWHEYRSLETITGASGTAIPYGIYSGVYQPPGTYTYGSTNPSVPGYFSLYNQLSGTSGPLVTGTSISGISTILFSGTITGLGVN